MQRYEARPWDIRRCDMVRCDDGPYVRHADAQAEIARLTAENDRLARSVEFWTSDQEKRWVTEKARAEKAEAERDEALRQHPQLLATIRAQEIQISNLEAERDAIAAAAFEAAADEVMVEALSVQGNCNVETVQGSIRALTPADARATLDRMLRQAKAEGMREAAGISDRATECCHSCASTGQRILARASELT